MEEKQFITKEYLDKSLNEKLKEHSQVLVEAIDKIVSQRLKEGLENIEENLKKEINNVQTLIDAYVKAQEDFKQEFVIIKEEINRIKEILKEKLGVEVRI